MPLDEFADEVVSLLEAPGTADEILVENVKFLRHAAERGACDQVVATFNGPR